MELYSKSLELRCLKTLSNKKLPKTEREILLGRLDSSYFYFPPALSAYNRIRSVVSNRGILLEYDDILEDPTIEEDFREILRNSEEKPCNSLKSIKVMMGNLSKYRQARSIYFMCKSAINSLKEDKVNVEEILTDIGEQLAKTREDINKDTKVYSMGHEDNSKDLIHEVLHKTKEPLIKTGFVDFDKENGGLPTHGVVILAGTTSGGKSVMCLNILANIYKTQHKSVCRISFEMDEIQETERLLSMESGIPYFKFFQDKLSPSEKESAKKHINKFRSIGKKHKARFSTISPTRSMTIEETLLMVKPFNFNVIAIDYITLLEGADGTSGLNQSQALSDIVRQCKIFSKETHTLVILLAQLDSETDKLRYSRAMQEHSDVVWTWNYSRPEQRESKIIPIKPIKVRQGVLRDFELKDEFEYMRVSNLDTPDEETSIDDSDNIYEDSKKDNSDTIDYEGAGIT